MQRWDSLLEETDCFESKCEKWRNQEGKDFAASPPAATSVSTRLWQTPQLQKLRVSSMSAVSEQAQQSPSRTWSYFVIKRYCTSLRLLFTSLPSLCSWGALSTLPCWLILDNNQRQLQRSVKWVPPDVCVRWLRNSELSGWPVAPRILFSRWADLICCPWSSYDAIANHVSVMMPSHICCPLHTSLKHWDSPLFPWLWCHSF